MGTVRWVGILIQCSVQIHCFKEQSIICELHLKKYLIAEGNWGYNGWAIVKRERTYLRESIRTYFLIQVTCNIKVEGHIWNVNIRAVTMPNENSPS